jgi:hypothetical protein
MSEETTPSTTPTPLVPHSEAHNQPLSQSSSRGGQGG